MSSLCLCLDFLNHKIRCYLKYESTFYTSVRGAQRGPWLREKQVTVGWRGLDVRGWRHPAAFAGVRRQQLLWLGGLGGQGLHSKEGPSGLGQSVLCPCGPQPPSCFSTFKRKGHFLDLHDPEAKCTWSPPPPNPDVWHHPNCFLHQLYLPPSSLYAGSTPGLGLSVPTPRGQADPSTPSQHPFPLHLHYRSPKC